MIVGEPSLVLGKYGEVKLRPNKSRTSMESFVELANSEYSDALVRYCCGVTMRRPFCESTVPRY